MKRKSLSKFLTIDPPRSGPRCLTCSLPSVEEAVRAYIVARGAGMTKVSFQHFHEAFLTHAFKRAPCLNAVRKHVRDCLGLDHVTGRPRR